MNNFTYTKQQREKIFETLESLADTQREDATNGFLIGSTELMYTTFFLQRISEDLLARPHECLTMDLTNHLLYQKPIDKLTIQYLLRLVTEVNTLAGCVALSRLEMLHSTKTKENVQS